MNLEMILGVALAIVALGAVVLLTLWSRRIIERLHFGSSGSLRQIQKDIMNGNRPS